MSPGDEIRFGLNLFGRAVHYLPYFILTFREAGLHGLGRGRGQCDRVGVQAIHPVSGDRCPIYDHESGCLKDVDLKATATEVMGGVEVMEEPRLTVAFLTYTRLMYLDAWVERVEFHILISRLLRRLEALSEIHGGARLNVDARELINHAKQARLVGAEHQWQDWERFFCRQNTKIRLGGVLGRGAYQADTPGFFSEYAPLLKLGELTHVGKGCVFGMGKIRVIG